MPPIDSSFILFTQPLHLIQNISLGFSILSLRCLMVPEIEKPRVTEIQVRMDCNGCVQKIKKALHGINGIYDLYMDIPQQKLTVIGWADPEKIIKAIRKTRKIATICSHSEPTEAAASAQPTEQPQQAPEGGAPPRPPSEASDVKNPSPSAAPPAEAAAPPAEPPKDPTPENAPPEEKTEPLPSPVAADTNASQPAHPPGPKDAEKVHVYHHPPNYGYGHWYGHSYGGHWNRQPNSRVLFSPEPPQPIYVTHSHNTYRPSTYVTEYEYVHSPPRHTLHSRMDHYNEDYHDSNRNSNGNITSMFSDENPNACRIV